ncbi:MAG TPA: thioredoxin family protein [Candidatus Kapabacteria bacterium]|jgi:small redox-active disulfide protein 2|nr:thioredoxin family protein [Candidatus Kapabacteria bacterium]HPP40581.1 thioredoxin family protein [Candidatus Kapabacteria bacterium]HPU23981.1 thioredoxin family protein [Candidatus Kapabacteria bacterium]
MLTIKVLGPGCAKCVRLQENVQQAVSELNIDAQIEKVTELDKIMSYGIMATPGLVINEKVVSFGKLLNVNDCKKIIEEYL